jgi:hypothetical protein
LPKTYIFSILLLLGAKDELFLLAPIDEGGETGDNEDGQVNGSGIKPS